MQFVTHFTYVSDIIELTAENKNPAYGRQSISQPMRILATIPQEGGPRIPKNPNLLKNGKKIIQIGKTQNV